MQQREIYQMPKAGNINSLTKRMVDLSDPGPGEVQIAVRAIGLNFADIYAMQGLYKATPKGAFIPGLEFSGEVLKCGKDVDRFSPGDRVMGATKFGGYVSHLNHPEDYVEPVPENWSFAQGAGFIVQGLTAFYALRELGNLKENQTVLIHSAAGGVGILANRIAKKFNAYTIGSVGSTHKVDFLRRDESYDEVIVRDKEFGQRLKDALKDRELNLVLESIGGQIFWDSYKAMAPMGRLITFGSASFMTQSGKPNMLKIIPRYLKRPKLDVMRMPSSNKSVMGFNLIWLYDRLPVLRQVLNDLMSLEIEAPHIGSTFSFNELPEAISSFQSGKTIGKVVVELS